MNNELNYPVKYAVLELKEVGNCSQGWKDITKGFIASKCYVVESKTIYSKDGSSKTFHKVVFPYKDFKTFKMLLNARNIIQVDTRNIPRYDAISKPYPVDIVADLFDTYEEAKTIANAKNKELYRQITCYLNIEYLENNLDRINKEFLKEIELCNLFEKASLEETEDMVISSNRDKANRKQTYNKLVRDKIPEIIRANGEEPITRILNDNEYKLELERKLNEEYQEVLNASGKDRVEELADMIEIMKYLAKLENSTLEEVIAISEEKGIKRGTFENKIFLERVLKK